MFYTIYLSLSIYVAINLSIHLTDSLSGSGANPAQGGAQVYSSHKYKN